jgi:hypothetical protein
MLAGRVRGWPWWACVLVAVAVGYLGMLGSLGYAGTVLGSADGAYALGCVAAVCLARRRSLFTPMVQPALVFVITVPAAVLSVSGVPGRGGTAGRLLAVATPPIQQFPVMAITWGIVVAIGLARLLTQHPPRPRMPAR